MVEGCGEAGACDPTGPPGELPAISFVYLEQCGDNGKFSVRIKETCLPYIYFLEYHKHVDCNGQKDSVETDTIQLDALTNPCAGIEFFYACVKAVLISGCCDTGYVGYRTVNYKTHDGVCPNCTACTDSCQGAFVEIVGTECNPDGNLIGGEGGSQYERWVPGREYTVELSTPLRVVEVEVYDTRGRLLYRGGGEADMRSVWTQLRRRVVGEQMLWLRLRYADGREEVKRWLVVE